MIRPSVSISKIYLYRNPVDFRKMVNGLSLIVEHELNLSPMDGHLYVFFNRNRRKTKILYWDKTGFVLYSKHLEQDRFSLPKSINDVITINGEQLNWILDGINIDLIKPHQTIYYQHAG